jgi:arsenite methyltransferase
MEHQDAVKDYYGNKLSSTNDLKATGVVQCSRRTGKLAAFVTEALSLVHEDIANRSFGCATAYPEALTGARVLDLGAGCGRDCFVLSKVVGESGTVVGLDMTQELLELARDKIEYHTSKFGYSKSNVSFVQGYLENMREAGLVDDFFDVIVSNCVISLCSDKKAVLQEAHRVLKPGGELYFSDVYRDGQLSSDVLDDKKMWCEGLIGALTRSELQDFAKELGFTVPRVVRADPMPIVDEDIKSKIGQVKYSSVTYRLFKKLHKLDETQSDSADLSAQVKYNGGIRGCEESFTFDQISIFKKGEVSVVDSEIRDILAISRFAPFFEV